MLTLEKKIKEKTHKQLDTEAQKNPAYSDLTGQ